jgi:site-specific recombinase XerD
VAHRLTFEIPTTHRSPREAEFDVALYTGMRWSEQYSLRWAQVKLQRNTITLSETKSGMSQHVKVNTAAHRALEELRATAPDSEFVCPSQDEWTHRQWWDAVRNESKISNFHWHDLRHTFASRLVMNGVDIYTVNKLGRHETLQVTKRYAHLADTHLQQAVERLAGVTRSVTGPREASSPLDATIH